MSSMHETLEKYAAILWGKPMTEEEMDASGAFKFVSTSLILHQLDRLGWIYQKGDKFYTKKSAALSLSKAISIRVTENCRRCNGTGVKQEGLVLGVEFPCDRCGGTGERVLRDYS